MEYNLKSYLAAFQRATAVHVDRNVIVSRASPQFCNPEFLALAVRELCPGRIVRLGQACKSLASTGYVEAISPSDRAASEVKFAGCTLITVSAFTALARLVSYDVEKIPSGLTVRRR